MVQFQKPKKIYNDRRLFFGGGPGIMSNFSFGSIASSSQNVDRRSNHSKGSFMPPGPPNGAHKPGLHTDGYPMPRVPIPPYHGGPQPYATPTRGAVHGPVGVVPHVPQPGSQDFGAGHGSDGAPIGSHLPHQQGPQQPIGNIGSNFNFPALESPSSQPSIGGPLSQPGYVSNESGQKLVGSTFGVARFAFSACHLHSSHFRAHLSISRRCTDERLKVLRQVETPVSPEEEAIHHGHTSSSPLAAGEDAPFRWDHVRVKLKKEIVSLGMPSVSPIERVGKYVSPKDWNSLISDPDTVVIDVRNDYETRIGKFKGAVNPNTTAFREFPSWVDDQYQPDQTEDQKQCNGSSGSIKRIEEKGAKVPPRVAMYCTGGIRCEKATSLLLSKGFKEVYHLEGGILKYLEEVPKTESLWEGECFVFDKRVSVEHGLVQGTFKLCYGCKQPVSDADMETPEWEYGVCCPYCYSSKSEEEKERARARQRQFEAWGVIGGPDKGRRPAKTLDGNEKTDSQMSKSA